MKLLLDTHVLLWWLEDPGLLSEECRKTIKDSSSMVYVSAAVIWEIIIKRALGKLEIPSDIERVLAVNDFHPLSVSIFHALTVEMLPHFHRDPFDRMLIAQAICEGLTLATRDPNIMKYTVSYMVA